MEVKKIRKEGEQMKITIPKKSNFKVGDYVLIKKIPNVDFLFQSALAGKINLNDLEQIEEGFSEND
jgi:hypothetical protein